MLGPVTNISGGISTPIVPFPLFEEGDFFMTAAYLSITQVKGII